MMRRMIKDVSHDIHGVRARALEAASDILATQGLEKLNLRLIAEKADIGLTSIYYYFASKEDLLLSLALSGFDEVRRRIAQAVAADQENGFRAGSRAYLGYSQRKPALYALMYDQQLMSRHEVLREAEDAAYAEFLGVVKGDPRFPSERAAGIAYALWALGRGVAAMALSQEDGSLTPEQTALFSDGANYLIARA